MAVLGDALRQAFMPKHEYQSLREEDRAWLRLQRPFLLCILVLIALGIVISTLISLNIVFPKDNGKRPFCSNFRLQPLSINVSATRGGGGNGGDSDLFPGAFYLTDQETVNYYWMVVFVPSAMVFLASAIYLVSGKPAPERGSEDLACGSTMACVERVQLNGIESFCGG
ncbi:unnamed protein product [Ilex paraguariensis]|uniref:Uncharacterized protein n=1 Tax=Ilex paraguariensis TaxID=185542 RepID=A0ABC8QUI2_9AQUA